jgi:hypothetical protein
MDFRLAILIEPKFAVLTEEEVFDVLFDDSLRGPRRKLQLFLAYVVKGPRNEMALTEVLGSGRLPAERT